MMVSKEIRDKMKKDIENHEIRTNGLAGISGGFAEAKIESIEKEGKFIHVIATLIIGDHENKSRYEDCLYVFKSEGIELITGGG